MTHQDVAEAEPPERRCQERGARPGVEVLLEPGQNPNRLGRRQRAPGTSTPTESCHRLERLVERPPPVLDRETGAGHQPGALLPGCRREVVGSPRPVGGDRAPARSARCVCQGGDRWTHCQHHEAQDHELACDHPERASRSARGPARQANAAPRPIDRASRNPGSALLTLRRGASVPSSRCLSTGASGLATHGAAWATVTSTRPTALDINRGARHRRSNTSRPRTPPATATPVSSARAGW